MLHAREGHKTINKFFSTNFAGQKKVALYIQNAERKKTFQPRISYTAKLSFKVKKR